MCLVAGDGIVGSQFYLSLGPELSYLDKKNIVIGELAEGMCARSLHLLLFHWCLTSVSLARISILELPST